MNTISSHTISFGKMVSTYTLLRAGSGAMNFDEAKQLNNQIGVKYSGYIGFYKRALDIVDKVSKQDSNLAKIFEDLKLVPKNNLEPKIKKYVMELGENIDINV